jgi:PAS domain S-box-containing protein
MQPSQVGVKSKERLLTAERLIAVGFVIVLSLLVFIPIATYRHAMHLLHAKEWLTNHGTAMLTADTVHITLVLAELELYKFAMTADRWHLDSCRSLLNSMRFPRQLLADSLKDSPDQMRRLASLNEKIQTGIDHQYRLAAQDTLRYGLERASQATLKRLNARKGYPYRDLILIRRTERSALWERQRFFQEDITKVDAAIVGSMILVLLVVLLAMTRRYLRERKQAEQAIQASETRVRLVIDSMPVALLIASTDGKIESANPRTEQMFGYAPADLLAKNLVELFPSSLFDSFAELVEKHKTKAVGGTAEWQARRADGALFPVELQLNDFTSQDGQRILVIMEDVSEHHEIEKLKRQFVAMVSHELRTPLTSIRGSLGLAAAGKLGQLPDKALRAVTIAERNTVRLAALINDILDLEKLEAGKMDLHTETVQLGQIIERSLESVRAFADQHEIHLGLESEPKAVCLLADGDRLVQVLVNLLSNAVKFSRKGGSVTISVEESPGWVMVAVTDTGRGIPEAYKERIFERFQQVEQADAKKRGGSGLGLAICKAIVEQHGGQIGVESEEGKGSRFWFRLPTGVVTSAVAGV